MARDLKKEIPFPNMLLCSKKKKAWTFRKWSSTYLRMSNENY